MTKLKLLSQMTHEEIQTLSEEQIKQASNAESEYYNKLLHLARIGLV